MLIRDIRQAIREWRRSPVLTLTALLTLSIGVGANAAVFSVTYAVLFRPLPYPAPERLMEVFEETPTKAAMRVSALNYLTWTERTKAFEALAAFQSNAVTVLGDDDAERVAGARITASLFRVLGVSVLAGRELRAEDERRESPRVALLSHSFWQHHYGSDPSMSCALP